MSKIGGRIIPVMAQAVKIKMKLSIITAINNFFIFLSIVTNSCKKVVWIPNLSCLL